jgi:hypothetical protein
MIIALLVGVVAVALVCRCNRSLAMFLAQRHESDER